jgi:rhamnosyltransferase
MDRSAGKTCLSACPAAGAEFPKSRELRSSGRNLMSVTARGAPDEGLTEVAALIVAFRPIQAQLSRLVEILTRECAIVYVIDNGGGREAIADSLKETPCRICVVDMIENRGIGAALNLGFQCAAAAGVKYVVTFDQDSAPKIGLTAALVCAIEQFASRGIRVAAVGPRIVDVRSAQQFDYPFMRRRIGWPIAVTCTEGSESIEADYLITSGCLIPLSIFQVVGPFDHELFVDCTDMEWCFRARALGYRLYGICAIPMPHELGTGDSTRAAGITFLGHSPIRRYYYARNTVRLLKLRHVAPGWKMRMLMGLIARVILLPVAAAFRKGWTRDWRMLIKGVFDGVAGTGGPCAYVP